LRGIVLELDESVLQALDGEQRARLTQQTREAFGTPDAAVLFEAYRVGSAFLHPVKIVR